MHGGGVYKLSCSLMGTVAIGLVKRWAVSTPSLPYLHKHWRRRDVMSNLSRYAKIRKINSRISLVQLLLPRLSKNKKPLCFYYLRYTSTQNDRQRTVLIRLYLRNFVKCQHFRNWSMTRISTAYCFNSLVDDLDIWVNRHSCGNLDQFYHEISEFFRTLVSVLEIVSL